MAAGAGWMRTAHSPRRANGGVTALHKSEATTTTILTANLPPLVHRRSMSFDSGPPQDSGRQSKHRASDQERYENGARRRNSPASCTNTLMRMYLLNHGRSLQRFTKSRRNTLMHVESWSVVTDQNKPKMVFCAITWLGLTHVARSLAAAACRLQSVGAAALPHTGSRGVC